MIASLTDVVLAVEEKFGEQKFRVLSEMRGEIPVYKTLKIINFETKLDENAEIDSAKI